MKKGVHIIRALYREPPRAPAYFYTSIDTPLGLCRLALSADGWAVTDEHCWDWPVPAEALAPWFSQQERPHHGAWMVSA